MKRPTYDYSQNILRRAEAALSIGEAGALLKRMNVYPTMHPKHARDQHNDVREALNEALAALDAADAAIPAAVKVMEEAK